MVEVVVAWIAALGGPFILISDDPDDDEEDEVFLGFI